MTFSIKDEEDNTIGLLLFDVNKEYNQCIFRLLNGSDRSDSAESELILCLQKHGEFNYFVESDAILITHPKLNQTIKIEGNKCLKFGDKTLRVVQFGHAKE